MAVTRNTIVNIESEMPPTTVSLLRVEHDIGGLKNELDSINQMVDSALRNQEIFTQFGN